MRLKIKELRKSRDWTQEHLAALSGLSVSFLSQLETGARQPSTETLTQLSSAFGVPVASLIDADNVGSDLPEMIDGLSKISESDRAALMTMMRALRDRPGA